MFEEKPLTRLTNYKLKYLELWEKIQVNQYHSEHPLEERCINLKYKLF